MWKVLLYLTLIVGFVPAAWPGSADPSYCNVHDLAKIGYFDYRDRSPLAMERKSLVEGAHFTESVRRGIAGNTGSLVGDVHYVLSHLPNHPQALMLMAEIQAEPGFKRNKVGRKDYYYDTVSCYFERAIYIAPDDPAVYLVRAIVLHRKGEYEQAKVDYLHALKLNSNYAEAHYNLGLLYLTLNELEKAQSHAERAYALGYPLDGLKKKLVEAAK